MEIILPKFEEALAELAWSLWNELGVSGNRQWHQHCLISLEELIILTVMIADFDPRLRDEALEWCSKNHHYVSITRLKTLIKEMDEKVAAAFSVFAATINAIVPAHWPVFSKVNPLKFSPRREYELPNLKIPSLLQLQLRALFGVGARADLFAFLLIADVTDFTASDAARIGYSKRSVADLLDNLVLAGVLEASFTSNQKKYSLKDPRFLRSMIRDLPKTVPAWDIIIQFLVAAREIIMDSHGENLPTKIVKFQNIIKIAQKRLHLTPPPVQSDLEVYWKNLSEWLLGYVRNISRGSFGGVFMIEDHFDEKVCRLMQLIYVVDDCLDGMEFVFSESKNDLNKHSRIYEECIMILKKYTNELNLSLHELLVFPFHALMDFEISESVFAFSDAMKEIDHFTEQFEKTVQVSSPYHALKQYEHHQRMLNKIYHFMHVLKERLKVIYFAHTDVHLLTCSPKLFKRHEVRELFSKN